MSIERCMRRVVIALAFGTCMPVDAVHAQQQRRDICWWRADVERCSNIIIAELGGVMRVAGPTRRYQRYNEIGGFAFDTDVRTPTGLSFEAGLLHAVNERTAVGGTVQVLGGGATLSARARTELDGAAFVEAKLGVVRSTVHDLEVSGGGGDRRGLSMEARVGLHGVGAIGLRYDDVGWPELPAGTTSGEQFRWIDDAPGRQRTLSGVVALDPPGSIVGVVLIAAGTAAILILLSGMG